MVFGQTKTISAYRNIFFCCHISLTLYALFEDDEWYEVTGISSPHFPVNPGAVTEKAINGGGGTTIRKRTTSGEAYLSPILRSESAAEIEVMEHSLISLLENFRSGRMKACKTLPPSYLHS